MRAEQKKDILKKKAKIKDKTGNSKLARRMLANIYRKERANKRQKDQERRKTTLSNINPKYKSVIDLLKSFQIQKKLTAIQQETIKTESINLLIQLEEAIKFEKRLFGRGVKGKKQLTAIEKESSDFVHKLVNMQMAIWSGLNVLETKKLIPAKFKQKIVDEFESKI